MEKAKTTSTNNQRQSSPVARWAQAGLALGLAYILFSWAIDTGSLLQYAAAALFIGLGIRHIVQGVRASRGKK